MTSDWLGEFRRGALITMAEVLPGFVPPSTSMDPNATVNDDGLAEDLKAIVEAPPRVQITRTGRWEHVVELIDGMFVESRWYVLGRERAERKARRKLNRYKARQERETWTIT
jgi:hypothetical protein